MRDTSSSRQEIETGYTCRMRRSGGTRNSGGGVGRAEVEGCCFSCQIGAAGRSARTTEPAAHEAGPHKTTSRKTRHRMGMDITWLTDRIAVGGGIWNADNMAKVAEEGITHIIDMQIEFDDTALGGSMALKCCGIRRMTILSRSRRSCLRRGV